MRHCVFETCVVSLALSSYVFLIHKIMNRRTAVLSQNTCTTIVYVCSVMFMQYMLWMLLN